MLQIPSLWRLRKIGKVYIRTGPLSFLLTLAARAFGYKKIVLEVNGWLADELKALNMPWVLTALYEKIQVFELKRASSVRVVTTGLKNIILAANIEEDKVHIIENGTDIDLFTPLDQVMCRQELNLKPDIRYLVFVGNLARWQDLPTAFKAMPALLEAGYDVEMLILGEGREMDRFIAKAKQYGLEEKVHFLGKKSPETVNKYLSASDIGLAPFTSQRNKRIGLSPLKVRDYAAGGLPVASTLLPGLEQLKNETWIHLAEPDNAEALRMLGAALLDLGRVEEAREAIERALGLRPEEARYHNDLGVVLHRLGRYEAARTAFADLARTALKVADTFGPFGPEPLREAFCPMALDGKGAAWLQRADKVENPFYGSSMYRCGEIRRVIEGGKK